MATKTRHDLLMERIRSQYEGNKAHSPIKEEEEKNDRNWLGKVGATGADILDSLGTGIAKGLEGVVDAGATLAGNVGSWFGADDDWAEDFVAKDHVGTFKQNNMQGWNDYIQDSYVYDMSDTWEQIIHGSVQSIGNMLPAIGVGVLTGGVGSMAMFGASAMGGGVEGALQQGHDFQTATNYGILEAGKELVAEAIGAKFFDSKLFGVLGKSVGKTGARNLVKEVGKQAFGEGMEEVIGGAFEPLIQKLTISKDESVWDLFGDAVRQMPMDFISGALTGALMNGGTTVVNVAQHGTNGVKAKAVVEDAHGVVNEIVELEKKHTKLGDERFNERYKVLQNELVELSKEYEGYMSKINAKYGEGSLKAKAYESGSKYLEDMKSSSSQDLTIRESIDKFNKNNKKNVKYSALDQNTFAEKIKAIRGAEYTDADSRANAFVTKDGEIIVNKSSKAYKEGRLYNKIGHEFLHTIEGTKEYKVLYDDFVNGLSSTQKDAILEEYRVKRKYGDIGEEALLKEAFADHIGENVTVNYDEFAKLLGTNSKLSKAKEKLLGYKGVLNEKYRNIQNTVKNTLQANNLSLATAKASKETQYNMPENKGDETNEQKARRTDGRNVYEPSKRGSNKEIQERKQSRIYSGKGWNVSKSSQKIIKRIYKGNKHFLNNDSRRIFDELLHQNGAYKLQNIDGSFVNVIKKEYYTKTMKDIETENNKFGIKVDFLCGKSFDKTVNVEKWIGTFVEPNEIYIKLSSDNIIRTIRHERMHYFQWKNEGRWFTSKLSDYFKNNSDELKNISKAIEGKYHFYEKVVKKEMSLDEAKIRTLCEIQSKIYSKDIILKDEKFQNDIISEFDDMLSKKYLEGEPVRFSRDVDDGEVTPTKTIEIKEDYDASRNYKTIINGEEYAVYGIESYKKLLNENKIKTIESRLENFEDILADLENIDIETAILPPKEKLEKMLNYANAIQKLFENTDIEADFSYYLDEESNINKIYDYLSQEAKVKNENVSKLEYDRFKKFIGEAVFKHSIETFSKETDYINNKLTTSKDVTYYTASLAIDNALSSLEKINNEFYQKIKNKYSIYKGDAESIDDYVNYAEEAISSLKQTLLTTDLMKHKKKHDVEDSEDNIKEIEERYLNDAKESIETAQDNLNKLKNRLSKIKRDDVEIVDKPVSKEEKVEEQPKTDIVEENRKETITEVKVEKETVVEEPKEVEKEVKAKEKTIEKPAETVEESVPVEEVAETTGKEQTVVTEIKKVIIQNTRKVSVADNAKTLQYGANLYNKKVYSIEGDANILRKKIVTELKEKYKISFRAIGEGYEALNHKVMATLNSIDNITEDQRIDTITGYFLEHIKTDNAEAKQFVRNVVSDTVHNGGKPSLVEELRQAYESKNEELAKEKQTVIDDYYKKLLKQIDVTNTYKQLVKELTAEFKTLTKSKNVDEKKIAKLEERIKKLTTEFNSRLDSKDKYANQLKEELRALKKQVSAKNVEINTLKSENKALEKGKERAERKKATAMTASYGQKVIDSSFYKMIDEFDFSELVGEGYTIEKPKFDSSFYDKITSALSKNQIDYAVKLFTDRIAKYDVVDKNGNKTKINQGTESWKEFESEIKHTFTEFFDNANKTSVQLMKEEVQKEHAIMKGTVALITTTNAIKNKLKKKHGVSQTLNKLAVDFVSDIAKPSLTSVRNGMYQEAVKNAYNKLTTKDANGKTLIEKFGEPFDTQILEKMKNLTGEVTVEQIEDMVKIARYVSSYLSKASGTELVEFNGKSKTVKEWAIEAMAQQRKLAGTKKTRKWLKRLSALSPRVVFKYMDGFEDGINTYFYEQLLKGESKEHETFVTMYKKIADYYETDNGKKIKKMINKEVTINGVTATVGEYMSIWKLLSRDDARLHIANSGFSTTNSKGELKEHHFNKEQLDEFENAVKKYFDFGNAESIYNEYINKTTEFFEYAKELKMTTDNDVKGYTNVINGEYFPIKVVAHDRLTQMGENMDFMSVSMQGSREYSFNSSVEGLKGILEVSSIEEVMQVYSTQMARYVAYAKTIDNINSVYNYKLTKADVESRDDLHVGETMRNVMSQIFGTKNGISNVTNYYNTLLKDVQGIRTNKDGWFEKLRSKFATFQLGANLKVMANQFSAMPTALKYIKPHNLLLAHKEIATLGLNIKLEDMPYTAQYRIMNKSMISAHTLNQKVGKVANVFGKGMEFTDNLVIKTIWKASLIQCNNNVAEATELFDKTIRETQGFNTLERSSLLRSENSLIKSMMMFTIQPSHNLSNLMEWWLHLRSGKKMTKSDKTKYAGAIGGLLMEGAIYTAIGLLFKRLLGKDEDDEYEVTNILETFFNDNLMGMIPFLNNIEVDFDMTSGKLLQMNDFSVGAIGQLYDAFDEMQNVFDTDSDPMAKLKSLTYATGMVTGIPTRNINNYTTALLKVCGVEGAYDWEILSNGKSLYNKEAINDALERSQMTKAKKYYEVYTNKIVPLDEKTTRELYNMYSCGYKEAYIKQIPYTIEGVDENYTTDIEKFRTTYSSVGSTLKKLTSHPMYTTLNDKKKEKLIKQVVNTHYNIAYKEQSGEALTTMEMLVSKGYNPTRTFIWLSEISEIKETYSMTRKEAVQKYINRLPLMSNEKYLIYMLAGYKLTDDKVVLVKNFLRMKGLSYKDINQIFG